MQVAAVHRRAGLAHLRGQHPADGLGRALPRPHGERHAEIANHRCDDVAAPRPAGATKIRPASKPYRGGVNRLLAGRPEALALEGGVAVAHLPAREERLEAVVGRARQQHAAQDLPPLAGGERRGQRLAPQETVAGLDQLVERLGEPFPRRHARRRLVQSGGRSRIEVLERGAQTWPQAIDRRLVARGTGATGALERLPRLGQGKREPLGDERPEPTGQAGRRKGVASSLHAVHAMRERKAGARGPGTRSVCTEGRRPLAGARATSRSFDSATENPGRHIRC